LEKAAAQRLVESACLFEQGHYLAVIYLSGYAAEMTLSLAYLGLIGYGPNDEVKPERRNELLKLARGSKNVSHRSHPIDGWAKLLIDEKDTHPNSGYDKQFRSAILGRVNAVCRHWSHHLRYRDISASSSQAKEVGEAARWLVDHSHEM